MSTVFPRPRFPLTISPRELTFVNVDNRLQLTADDVSVRVPINVDSGLFSIMRLLGIPRHARVTLYLDSLDGKRFMFGIATGPDDFHDLWTYHARDLKYILPRLRRRV